MTNNPNTTHKIFSSRLNFPADQYVGEAGRMFYHEDTGELRLSDGITPGGLPIIFKGSATLTANIVVKSSTYNFTNADFTILANASAGAFTINLPASPVNGELSNIKKIDSTNNIVTINGNGYNIDGSTSIGIRHQYNSVTLQFDTFLAIWNII